MPVFAVVAVVVGFFFEKFDDENFVLVRYGIESSFFSYGMIEGT